MGHRQGLLYTGALGHKGLKGHGLVRAGRVDN